MLGEQRGVLAVVEPHLDQVADVPTAGDVDDGRVDVLLAHVVEGTLGGDRHVRSINVSPQLNPIYYPPSMDFPSGKGVVRGRRGRRGCRGQLGGTLEVTGTFAVDDRDARDMRDSLASFAAVSSLRFACAPLLHTHIDAQTDEVMRMPHCCTHTLLLKLMKSDANAPLLHTHIVAQIDAVIYMPHCCTHIYGSLSNVSNISRCVYGRTHVQSKTTPYKRECGNTMGDIHTPKAVTYHEPDAMRPRL